MTLCNEYRLFNLLFLDRSCAKKVELCTRSYIGFDPKKMKLLKQEAGQLYTSCPHPRH